MTREEAKEILLQSKMQCDYPHGAFGVALDIAIGALEQEQEIGHWILDETDNSITCDKCGCSIWANDINNGDAYFCPNCGFKMESEG